MIPLTAFPSKSPDDALRARCSIAALAVATCLAAGCGPSESDAGGESGVADVGADVEVDAEGDAATDAGGDVDGGSAPAVEPARIDQIARNELEQQTLTGLAVGVVHDGQVAYTEGYGQADVRAGRPVTEDTLFRWGALSETLTSVTAAMLEEEGELDLDRDISRHLHGYREVDVEPLGIGPDIRQRWAATWVDNAEALKTRSHVRLPNNAYVDKFREYEDDYRMVDLERYAHNGDGRWAGVWWENSKDVRWAEQRNLTSSEFSQKFQDYQSDFYMVDIETYRRGGTRNWAGLWHENEDDVRWKAHRNVSSAEFGRLFNQYESDFRMIDIETYEKSGKARWAGIWRENTDDLAWIERRKLTRSDFRSLHDQKRGDFRLVDVEQYRRNGAEEWAGIWVENPEDRRLAEVQNISSETFGDLSVLYGGYPETGITTNHLLNHASGIPNHDDFSGDGVWSDWKSARNEFYGSARTQEPWDADAAAAISKGAELSFDPQAPSERPWTFDRTRFGYNVAGGVVEYVARDAYGKSYGELVRDWIRRPTGMTSLQPDYSEFKSLSDRTVGYRSRCASDPKREDTTDVSWKLPSAGWISNVRDLTRFVRALMDDTFLGKQARLELWDASVSEAAHANGFEVSGEPADDGWKISRSGSEQNAETYMGFLPNREIGVVAMSNTRGFDGERLWQKLVNELGASRELADVESPCN